MRNPALTNERLKRAGRMGGAIMKRIICLTLVLFLSSAFAGATNQVTITAWGNLDSDTIMPLVEGHFEIAIENDTLLGAISLGFVLSGTAPYHFVETSSGFLTNPDGVNFLEGVPGSRWMSGAAPDGSCWDLGGTHVTYDPDGGQPYQFLISGTASGNGLAPGPLQSMLGVYYVIHCWYEDENPRMLCIDSLKYQPDGDFIFVPGGTPDFYVTNSDDGCFLVSNVTCYYCPVWDENNPTSMTVNRCDTGQVTLSATDPEMDPVYYFLVGVTGGAGTATVGLNDGVITYIPDPSDVGKAVAIKVEATDIYHPQGECEYYACTIDVTVSNSAPTISCGNNQNIEGSGRLFKKFDITSADPDSCDDIQYSLTSVAPAPVGAYSIDPATGVFSFYTATEDGGVDYEVCVEASDGMEAASGCFTVTVCNCENPGDIDGTYDVNIGDAVALVAYIFKGAVAPPNMNWADVNADCAVNVSDVVYLINYIFKGGPDPQVGCYY
jgi:hypothetical protein